MLPALVESTERGVLVALVDGLRGSDVLAVEALTIMPGVLRGCSLDTGPSEESSCMLGRGREIRVEATRVLRSLSPVNLVEKLPCPCPSRKDRVS